MKIESWKIEEETGYTPITTFYEDLSIADNFGLSAIQETFDNVVKNWLSDYKYFTEFILALNWKCWRWFEVKNDYSELYSRLYYQARDIFCDKYENNKEVMRYYFDITD